MHTLFFYIPVMQQNYTSALQQKRDQYKNKATDYRHASVDTFGRENKAGHVCWHVEATKVPYLLKTTSATDPLID